MKYTKEFLILTFSFIITVFIFYFFNNIKNNRIHVIYFFKKNNNYYYSVRRITYHVTKNNKRNIKDMIKLIKKKFNLVSYKKIILFHANNIKFSYYLLDDANTKKYNLLHS